MDGMEVDNVSKCSRFQNKKINLIFSKNCSNNKWSLSQKSGKNTLTSVPKRAPKPKPSLKISLPIIHYLRAMQKYKNANAGMKAPPYKTEERRLPQQLGIPPTTPLPLGPSTLRTFRHPVPTSKGRTMFADKVALKTPEPLINKATSKCDPSMPGSNINVSPIIDPAKKKTEELNTPQSKPNTTMSYNTIHVSIKHKLPLTVVAPNGSYGNRSSNPVNTSNNTQTTVVQATQTEKVFIVTEQGYQILETIKNSGLTSEDLHNLIDKFKKKKENHNDEDCVVIDLERAEENNESKNENLDIVMKHSVNNKNILNTCVHMMQMVSSQNHQLLLPAVVPPPERRVVPHRNDPRRQSMHSRLGWLPRLSRVLSTQEANMHSQAAQHSDCSWYYPQYFDRHGNVFPQRHP